MTAPQQAAHTSRQLSVTAPPAARLRRAPTRQPRRRGRARAGGSSWQPALLGPAEPAPVPSARPAADPDGPGDIVALARAVIPAETEVCTLQVQGEELKDALLGPGDIVLLQPGPAVASGDLAAVWLCEPGRLAVRRVYFENGHVRLQPEDRALAPLIVERAAIELRGRVIAIIRQRPGDRPS
jgi:hypothetical protein